MIIIIIIMVIIIIIMIIIIIIIIIKLLLKFLQNSQENTCARVSFGRLRPATLLKKRLQHRCLRLNFAKFLVTPFFRDTSGDCFFHNLGYRGFFSKNLDFYALKVYITKILKSWLPWIINSHSVVSSGILGFWISRFVFQISKALFPYSLETVC